jgi:hypothetical protein
MESKEGLEHHLAAPGSGEVAEILNDSTDASILRTADETYRGREAIGGCFTTALSGPFTPGTSTSTMVRQAK